MTDSQNGKEDKKEGQQVSNPPYTHPTSPTLQNTPGALTVSGSVLTQAMGNFQTAYFQNEPNIEIVKEHAEVVKQLSSDALKELTILSARGSKSDDYIFQISSTSSRNDLIFNIILLVVAFTLMVFGCALVVYEKANYGIPIITGTAGLIGGFYAGKGYVSHKTTA